MGLTTLLLMDVGNSNIKIGISQHGRITHHWRVSTDSDRTADEFGVLVRGLLREGGQSHITVNGIVVCSVVPPIHPILETMCQQYFGLLPMMVGPGLKSGLNIQVENSRDVGADRIVNAVAALHLKQPPIIIVDFGTATTFSVLDESGTYIGGAIAPGVSIASEALYQRAAKLPRVELVKPKSVIGRNVVSSMQSGILHGFAGLVDGMVQRIKDESTQHYTVIGTGGFATLIAPMASCVDEVIPDLTLQGLVQLWDKNANSKG